MFAVTLEILGGLLFLGSICLFFIGPMMVQVGKSAETERGQRAKRTALIILSAVMLLLGFYLIGEGNRLM